MQLTRRLILGVERGLGGISAVTFLRQHKVP